MELKRKLSLLDSTMINVGTMIGSGIFVAPAAIALQLDSAFLILIVWTLGGIISLFGALSVAELGAMMPDAGGMYVYLGRVYGELWGFMYGWTAFLIINTASIAAVAVTCITYLSTFFPMGPMEVRVVAAVSIVGLTAVNCIGLAPGAMVQNTLTIVKILVLFLIVGAGFVAGHGSWGHFTPFFPETSSGLLAPFALAMVAVLWSYDGWIEITYVGGEVADPQRTLPRVMFLGTLLVVVLYSLIACAVGYVIPLAEVAHSGAILSDVATAVFGGAGAILVTAAVVVSTLGTNNGMILASPRIYHAMSRDGVFFRWLSNLHPRTQMPVASLIVQCVLACAFVLTGTFDQLIGYVVFASFLFYGMSAAAVIILRRRNPDLPRPYKAWGYPLTPLLFIACAAMVTFDSILVDPVSSGIGAGIIAAGIPCYYFWKKRS